jgi:DNA-binding Xre family transcriptional regulator
MTYEQKQFCNDVRRRLNEYLEEHPINLTEMARRVGVTKSVLNKFKTNYQPYLSVESVTKLDKFLEDRYH